MEFCFSSFGLQLRKASSLPFLLLTLGSGLAARPASAAIPGGDYQQTCRDITVAGTTLSASCRNRGGAYIQTRLTDFPLCIGNIANLDGILNCSKGARPPAGPYEQTCRDITANGNTLNASCRTRGGAWNRTTLANFNACIGNIDNLDGVLGCSKGNRPPGGSYQQSCRDVIADGITLRASCRDAGGTWRPANLSDFQHCVGDISNLNGTLRCSRGALPPGSYQRSCQQIFVTGNTLEAVCKSRGGSSIGSSLANFQTCVGEIYNVDGFLTCVHGQGNLPAGDYRGTCRDLSWNGSVLAGTCKSRRGAWGPTSLNDVGKCRGEINNIDGFLTCAKGDDNPPQGSYRQTCRNFVLAKGVLNASCLSRQGQWAASHLSYRGCIGDISNHDGVLTCNPPAPQKPPKPPTGVSKAVLFNCTADRRELHYWLFDLQDGSSRDAGTQGSQYDTSGTCPAGGSQAFEIPLTEGHLYRLVVVDPELGSCGANDPNTLACQKWVLDLRGAKAGPPWQIIVAP
jgi:hypothetical protein